MTRRPVDRWRRLFRVLAVAAIASWAMPQVSVAQVCAPLRRPSSMREPPPSRYCQVEVDRTTTRFLVEFTDSRKYYQLLCPSKTGAECTVEPIDLGDYTQAMLHAEARTDPAWLQVCPSGGSAIGRECLPAVEWVTKNKKTNLAGQGLTCPGDYILAWTLRTVPHAAVTERLTFFISRRIDGCQQTR